MSALQFEDLLTKVSGHGRWQWMLFIIGSLSGFFNAFHHVGIVFLSGSPEHWCRVPMPDFKIVNVTVEEWKNYTIPLEKKQDKMVFSECQMYDRDYTSAAKFIAWKENNINDSSVTRRECNSWQFDTSQYNSTIVTQWNLVCGRKALLSTVQSTYMAGVFVGCLVYGMISDRFGRRLGAMISLTLFIITGIAAAFSVHYIMFIVLRFILATSAAGLFTCTFVITTEITIPSYRTMFGIFFQIPFALGYMVLPGVAYLIRDWKYLQLAIAFPNILLLSYIWLLSESPRWLVTHGQFDKALAVMKRAARMNKHPLPPDEEILLMFKIFKEDEDIAKQSKVDQRMGWGYFRNLCKPHILRRIITMYFTWFSVAMVYYGLVLNVRNLDFDIYFMSFLNAAVEVPAYIIVYFLLVKGGRRIGYCGTFLAGGAACLLIMAVPRHVSWAIVTLAVLGKFCITATFAIAYLFTAELFPTVVRNIAVNSSSMCGRIGSILAPYVVDLLGGYNPIIPLIIFGTISVVAGVLALFLPETNKKNLTESWQAKIPDVNDVPLSSSSLDKLTDKTEQETRTI